MTLALACCLAVLQAGLGLLVDLVGRKDKLMPMRASSGVASRAAAVAGVIAGPIAADTEGKVGLVVFDSFETVLAEVPP